MILVARDTLSLNADRARGLQRDGNAAHLTAIHHWLLPHRPHKLTGLNPWPIMAGHSPPHSLSIKDGETASATGRESPHPSESPVLVSSHLSLAQAVHERRAEYTRSQRMKVKVGTWNVAALSGTEKDIGAWFVDGKGLSEVFSGISLQDNEGEKAEHVESIGTQERRRSKSKSTVPLNDTGALPRGDEIGIYVLGLQEIVDISSATEALRPFNDPHPARKWKQAVVDCLPPGYHQVSEQQLLGLYLLIFASEALMPGISSVSTTSVGTGLMGYMGNKGAVTTRLVLGETTRIVFVNCHLSAGVEKGNLDRRNWDTAQILTRTKFEPIYHAGGVIEEFGEMIGDEDFAFWFGDLNYRLEALPPDDVRRLLMIHTRKAYEQEPINDTASKQKLEKELPKMQASSPSEPKPPDTDASLKDGVSAQTNVGSSPSSPAASLTQFSEPGQDPALDPTSLQATISSLLPHDQLHNQMRARKAFHDGWREGAIDFLPTYKYDVGSVGMFDSSEKRRGPSWCDRILYRTRKDKLEYERRVEEEKQARRKDDEMKSKGVVEAAADEAVLFEYDPEIDGAEYDDANEASPEPDVVVTKAGFEDRLQLNHYTSHQRVLSSDHKPLDATFTLNYDAVDPDLKAKVYQEVARELDKAENDGRPSVTVVIDQQRLTGIAQAESSVSTFEGVNFGDVKYDEPVFRQITIANTGRVPAIVGFADRSVDPSHHGGIAPRWLSIHFDRTSDNQNPNVGALLEYTLQPGDATNVELTLHISDMDLVRRLNQNDEALEDVLVLRIHNGRDYFLPLRAKWLQSVFGRSIERLIRIPEGGVRKLQHQHPNRSSHGGEDQDKDGVKWSAPRELFRLTESIESLLERAVGEWEMTGKDRRDLGGDAIGWPFITIKGQSQERKLLQAAVREALDTDTPLNDMWPAESTSIQRLEAVGETLVHFLNHLADGIVTIELWTAIERGLLKHERTKTHLSPDEERTWILDILSAAPAHSVAFTFITFTLSRAANEIAPLRSHAGDVPTSPSAAFQDAFRDQLRAEDERGIRRRQVEVAYATVFGEAIVRIPEGVAGKARKASEARRTHVVEVFLRGYSQ